MRGEALASQGLHDGRALRAEDRARPRACRKATGLLGASAENRTRAPHPQLRLDHSSRDPVNLAKEPGVLGSFREAMAVILSELRFRRFSVHSGEMVGGMERSLRWLLEVTSRKGGMSEPGRDCGEGTGVLGSEEGQG